MLNIQKHRGPEPNSIWSEGGLVLGHRRLAMLDLSEAGRQPMHSRDGRWTIVFNGEVFNYRELRVALGGVFTTATDTEVLLEACAAWGVEKALGRVHGMFGFALWDGVRRELTLARDRAGEKPLVYFWDGSTLAFASELKALADFHGRRLDPAAADAYNPRIKRLDLAAAAAALARHALPALRLEVLDGACPPDRVPAFLNAADCLLLTSATEGSPMIVKEALACNLPIVSVDVGDVAERIRGVRGARLVAPHPEALANALVESVARPGRSDGRRKLAEFSAHRVAAELCEIYRHLAGQPPEKDRSVQRPLRGERALSRPGQKPFA